MKRPQILVLAGYGINCEYETAHTFNLPSVGGEATCVHVGDLIAQPQQLVCQIVRSSRVNPGTWLKSIRLRVTSMPWLARVTAAIRKSWLQRRRRYRFHSW